MNPASVQLRHTLRASTGTLIALGLTHGRCNVLPTTAYLLLGDRCRRTCAFCAQSCRSSSVAGMLSRVSWPEVSVSDLVERLRLAWQTLDVGCTQAQAIIGERSLMAVCDQAPAIADGRALTAASGQKPATASWQATVTASGPSSATGTAQLRGNGKAGAPLQRICVQVTDCEGVVDDLKILVPLLKEAAPVPVSVSFKPHSVAEIAQLFAAGVDRLGIALDASDPQVYAEVKGGDYESFKAYLFAAAAEYKGRISTHVIVGLGESEESAVRLIAECLQAGLTVGLFAFTPVQGTLMESKAQPAIGHYRRIQAASYLLRQGLISIDDIRFSDGKIESIDIEPTAAKHALSSGKAFETSGCVGCNRPYYNERPASIMYNYPRPLTSSEIEHAIEATGLWRFDRS